MAAADLARLLRSAGPSGRGSRPALAAGAFSLRPSAREPRRAAARTAAERGRSSGLIVSRQFDLQFQGAGFGTRVQEIDPLEDQELREPLDDGQEPFQGGVVPPEREPGDDLPRLPLLQVGVFVARSGRRGSRPRRRPFRGRGGGPGSPASRRRNISSGTLRGPLSPLPSVRIRPRPRPRTPRPFPSSVVSLVRASSDRP